MSYPKVPKICITCDYYTVPHTGSYQCSLKGCRLSYLAAELSNCEKYKLSKNYKKGGKFYEEQK